MVIYHLTKFVDARVLTRKLWTDEWTDVGRLDGHRQTVSDHNSSLSTPCSGELKIIGLSVCAPIVKALLGISAICEST